MITLDLTDDVNSHIKYKISKFPDGQQTIDLMLWTNIEHFHTNEIDMNVYVNIRSRLNSFKDLELIICAVQALRNINPNINISLYTPYFLGARSDRKFKEGGVNYLKQVICPILNSLKLFSITVLDPHSDVLEACLNNYKKIDNHALVKFALKEIDNKNNAQGKICLVSPDAGAYKKIFDVAQKFEIVNIITANKIREIKTGNIVKTEIPDLNHLFDDTKYVIVDDICDGGRTFIELAKAIKERKPSAKIYLVVTHGIFSAGLKPLNDHFEGIFATNSVVDIIDLDFRLKNQTELHKFSQYKVI